MPRSVSARIEIEKVLHFDAAEPVLAHDVGGGFAQPIFAKRPANFRAQSAAGDQQRQQREFPGAPFSLDSSHGNIRGALTPRRRRPVNSAQSPSAIRRRQETAPTARISRRALLSRFESWKYPRRAHTTPPPACKFCAVTQRDSSPARNSATSATSSGSPTRLNGDRLSAYSRNSLGSMSVAVNPGERTLTAIRRGPSSSASERANCSMAPLLPR